MFQLVWEEPALDDLADLCVLHQDRWADINGAADIIEYRLRHFSLIPTTQATFCLPLVLACGE
jgi:hypothetical protein